MERVEKSISGRMKFPNEQEKSLYLYTKLPTLYWFFDWRQNIDSLLNSSALLGFFSLIFIVNLFKFNFQLI